MTAYYVTTSGSDSNNGLTEGTAFATPGYAASVATTSGDIIYIKAGTYTLSTTTVNASGGPMAVPAGVEVEGYQTTAGDQGAKPIINAGTQAVVSIIELDSPGYRQKASSVTCVEVDGNSTATNGIWVLDSYIGFANNCIARNCVNGFRASYDRGALANCSAFNCSSYGFDGGTLSMCLADSCSTGFYGNLGATDRCISSNNTSFGFNFANFTYRAYFCVAYNNGNSGFLTGHDINYFASCISASNGGHGYDCPSSDSTSDPLLLDCADYNNTSGRKRQTFNTRDIRPINLTADPFTSASTGDFTLNNDAGGGAELRQIQLSGLAGVNGVFDVGAIDAVVTAGGGNVIVIED
jgi:hypothetical protein